ncbi:MAG: hypothetical protein IJC73_07550, partial [Lentisphaeria bacterium]|nr:hypothetical protein [Lentisphaeria bacterium]
MADYYAMYQGTKYEVEDYSAGIAKAKELGSEAVFYVDAQLPDSMHTFCAGVNVVFSGGYAAGIASKRYIFGGLSGSGEAESTSYTITDGVYNYVFGGSYNGAVTKNTEVNITGGTFNYVFAGGWPKAATEAPYENVVVNFGGGEVGQLCGCNYVGTVKNATINITGGFVKMLYAVSGANNGDIHVEKLTVNVSGGTVGNKNFSIRSKVGKTTANTIGDVVLNLTGGTGQASILGTEQTPGTATYKSVTINVDGINHSGKLVAGIYGCAPTDFVTVNVKSGVVGNVYGGSYGVSSLPSGMDMLEISCPLTVNVSGGTAGTVYGGSNSPKVSYKGTITVNLSGGTVVGIVTSGGGKNGTVEGDLITNISGGVLGNTGVYGGVYDASTTHVGNCYVTITGGTTGAGAIYGGGYSGEQTGDCTLVIEGGAFKAKTYGGSRVGQVNGNVTTIIRGGGTTESASYWTVGGGLSSVITGKATIKVENGRAHHIFMGAAGEGGQVLGGTDLTVTGSYITGAIQGGAYRGNVEGGTKVTITGSTIARDAFTSYGSEGWIVGASASDKSNTIGDMVTSVSNSIVNGTIVGGGRAGYCEGNVSLTVTDCTLGIFIDAVDEETGEDVKELYGGDIFAMGGSNSYFEFVGNANVTVSGVEALGGLYAVYGNALVQGDTTVTVSNSSFADGIFLEYGSWTEEEVEDGNVVTEAEYRESEINGNVVYNLTNVTVTGDVWGKGRNFDLASFVEEDQGVTLAVSGKLTVSGEVAYFQNITIAAGATIEAGSVTASAITATAAAEDGAYLLATGFAAQDSVITVVNGGGSTIGTVTLSEAVTSGSFNVGSDAYTVAISGDNLYLTKNAEVPAPPAPPIVPPVVENTTTAEIILTISDANHPS